MRLLRQVQAQGRGTIKLGVFSTLEQTREELGSTAPHFKRILKTFIVHTQLKTRFVASTNKCL